MSSLSNLYFGWALYDILCISLFVIVGQHIRIKRNQIMIAFSLICCSLAIWGNAITIDYRAYWKIIQQIVYGSHKYIHLEEIYIRIVDVIGPNYELFQACIYIPAYFIFLFLVNRFQINRINLFLWSFAILALYNECIGSRQFLFVMIFNLALYFLSQKKYISFLITLISSIFFHKMSYMAIPVLILFLIPIKGNLFRLSTLIFILAIISKVLFDDIINVLLYFYGNTGGVNYLRFDDVTGQTGSIWWTIISSYNKYLKYIICIYVLINTRKILEDNNQLNKVVYTLVFWTSSIAFYCIIIGLPFSYRLFSIGSFGLCYLISLIPSYVKIKNRLKVSYYIALIIAFILANAQIVGVSHSVMLGELQLE